MVDSLSRGGIDATSHVFGVQRTSQEDRPKSPGLFGGSKYIPRYHSAEIARPENRWTGANRFGYANPEMDRLINGWDTTLDRSQRLQHMLQMERIALTELPALPMYWNPGLWPGWGAERYGHEPDSGWRRRTAGLGMVLGILTCAIYVPKPATYTGATSMRQ